MKKVLAGMFMLGTVAFASAQTITFDNTTVDYGKIKPAADGNRVFTVKNVGDKPLIISRVQPSCGCTSPEFSQDPILPGKTGKIKIHYDTNRVGEFQKLIEVYSNDPVNSRSVIYIKGNVDPNAPTVTEKVEKVATDVKEATVNAGKAVAKTSKKAYKATKKAVKKTAEKL